MVLCYCTQLIDVIVYDVQCKSNNELKPTINPIMCDYLISKNFRNMRSTIPPKYKKPYIIFGRPIAAAIERPDINHRASHQFYWGGAV